MKLGEGFEIPAYEKNRSHFTETAWDHFPFQLVVNVFQAMQV